MEGEFLQRFKKFKKQQKTTYKKHTIEIDNDIIKNERGEEIRDRAEMIRQ